VKRLVTTLLVTAAVWPAAAWGQSRKTGVLLDLGTGLEVGGSGGGTVAARSPLFLDVGARTWTDEQPEVSWGGSLRVEVEGRASAAVVPFAEVQRPLGPLLLRPGVGVPFFFAPFTMLGLEGVLTARLGLGAGLALLAAVRVDAFFLGSDVPADSAVLMFNGACGVELAI
jgi:hypothetical protein